MSPCTPHLELITNFSEENIPFQLDYLRKLGRHQPLFDFLYDEPGSLATKKESICANSGAIFALLQLLKPFINQLNDV